MATDQKHLNILDRAVSFISPKAGLARAAWRETAEWLGKRGYNAAGNGKRLAKMNRTNKSAVSEVLDSLAKLRAFSRELERNEPLVRKALVVRSNNIVGTGIRPSIVSSNTPTQEAMRTLWKEWAETLECDYDQQYDFYGLTDLANMAMDRDGEVFILRRRDKESETIPLRLQLLEAEFVDENLNEPTASGGAIVQGIEFDSRARRVAYHIFKQNPVGSLLPYFTTERVRIPAEDVIHLLEVERPGQVRGIPRGVQAFIKLQDLSEYEDAELVRKKIAACFTAFVQTADGLPDLKDGRSKRMEPGSIQYVPLGDKVEIANPPHSDGYAEYIRVNILRYCAAYGISYESVGDLSNVNFSSGRMGWIETGRGYSKVQSRILIPKFCNTVFKWMQEAARLTGKINKGVATVSWTPPRREMIDPAKEYKAIGEAIRYGLITWQEAIRELGWDPEQFEAEAKIDKAMWDRLGLQPYCDPRFDKKGKDASEDSEKK